MYRRWAAEGKDNLYYLDLVEFRVQGTLFRVPTGGFISSNPNFFKDLVAVGIIELPDISRDMFKGLLLVMYPFTRTAQTYGEWLGALHLATLWGLSEIRKKAVTSICEFSEFKSKKPTELVLFAKEYKVGRWLRDAYCQIIQDKDLDVDKLHSSSDSEPLDWETVSRLVQAHSLLKVWPEDKVTPCTVCRYRKYELHRKHGYNASYTCSEHLSAGSCIDRVFQKEFVGMDFNQLYDISPAGVRLPLLGTAKFPNLSQTGPPVSSPFEQKQFIASAILDNSIIPCKAVDRPTYQCVLFTLGDDIRASHTGRYDLLPFSDQHFQWVKTSHGQIPVGREPIEGGYEEDGRLLYHAAALVEGERIPGKTGAHLGGAKIAWYDEELTFTEDYDILCWRSR